MARMGRYRRNLRMDDHGDVDRPHWRRVPPQRPDETWDLTIVTVQPAEAWQDGKASPET